jgi:hypothetical protein
LLIAGCPLFLDGLLLKPPGENIKELLLTILSKANFPSSLQRTVSTPHSSGFARLEFGAFYFAIEF